MSCFPLPPAAPTRPATLCRICFQITGTHDLACYPTKPHAPETRIQFSEQKIHSCCIFREGHSLFSEHELQTYYTLARFHYSLTLLPSLSELTSLSPLSASLPLQLSSSSKLSSTSAGLKLCRYCKTLHTRRNNQSLRRMRENINAICARYPAHHVDMRENLWPINPCRLMILYEATSGDPRTVSYLRREHSWHTREILQSIL